MEININLKSQDRLREWFSKRGSLNGLQLKGLVLGDSDVDYRTSFKADYIKTLPAAFNISNIKSKLIYSGDAANLGGTIVAFLRRVNSEGKVESLYNYPPDATTFSLGVLPPTLENGIDLSFLEFATNLSTREGWIVFLQTLPEDYWEEIPGEASRPMRLNEKHNYEIPILPTGWEMIYDETNSSFLLAKPANYVFEDKMSYIKIIGRNTGIEKFITFNY